MVEHRHRPGSRPATRGRYCQCSRVEYTPAPHIEELLANPITLDERARTPTSTARTEQLNPDGIAKFTGGMKLTPSEL